VDKVSALFIPLVIGIAGGTFAVWWFVSGLDAALVHGLTVLVVACPCALGIGAPVATAVAIGVAAEKGVLIRSSEVLEKLAEAKTVAFDKTRTLTRGELAITSFDAEGDKGEVLSVIASLEKDSAHPIGKAIAAYARMRNTLPLPVRKVTAIPGEGIRGEVLLKDDWKQVVIGTSVVVSSYVSDGSIPFVEHVEGTAVYAAWEGRLRAKLTLSDSLRPTAAETVRMLQARAIETIILSGDTEAAVKHVAHSAGIPRWYSRLMPVQKTEILHSLRSKGITVMVGDGINDAPSLAAADVGLTLGSATDIAKESADVTIIGDHLERIAWLLSLSKKTIHTIYWNLLWAFGYNGIGIALAVVGILQPVVAAGAMIVSSVFVIINSLRLRSEHAAT
jgi:Cu+-exporting ATPase